MLEKIMGKKSKVKILRLLISNDDQEYCLDDIAKSTRMSCGTIYPALSELLETRIIVQRKAGRSILYKINKNHTLFNKIKELLDLEKNSLLNVAKEFASSISKNYISAIILFGSVARGDFTEKSDIDILVSYTDERAKKQVRDFVDKILTIYDVHIVPIFLTQKEIEERIKRFDNFIITVINEGRLLYGEAQWLKK
jgi:predicted nucleotidyltransferase